MIGTNPTVIEIVKQYLLANGFDGLYNDAGDCGCSLSDINPCSEMCAECRAGYRTVHGAIVDAAPWTHDLPRSQQ